jgi:hypothetical protein
MKKKYKNKLCAYCGTTASETEDHVFARQFFTVANRANLPKVPACKKCNGIKADLERYATTVFPFGNRHESAKEIMLEKVPKRLQNNHALFRALHRGRKDIWVQESPGGIIQPSIAVPINGEDIVRLFQYIAKGLILHHWNVYTPASDRIAVKFFTSAGDALLNELCTNHPGKHVQVDLGNGSVRYEGIQDVRVPHATVWHIQMLGGISIASETSTHGVSSTIAVFTGQKL